MQALSKLLASSRELAALGNLMQTANFEQGGLYLLYWKTLFYQGCHLSSITLFTLPQNFPYIIMTHFSYHHSACYASNMNKKMVKKWNKILIDRYTSCYFRSVQQFKRTTWRVGIISIHSYVLKPLSEWLSFWMVHEVCQQNPNAFWPYLFQSQTSSYQDLVQDTWGEQ